MPQHTAHVSRQILRQLTASPRKRARVFLAQSTDDQLVLWARLPASAQQRLVRDMPDDALLALAEAMDPDQATDLVQYLSAERSGRIVAQLNERQRNAVSELLSFPAETAAGLMNLDYIQVEDTATIAAVGKHFKEHERRTGRPPAILVLCKGKLVGHLPLHQLALRKPADKIRKLISPVAIIRAGASHDDVVQTFRDNPHNKVVVCNERDNVLGIIFSDDILRLIKKEASSSLLSFAGVQEEETVLDSTLNKVHRRYTWLIINLGTAFLAASTVGLFEGTIAKHVLLAVYMPIVAGMGGNAATQTLAVVVRGIALQQIDLGTGWRTLWRELGAGLLNGIINGLIVAAIIMWKHDDIRLALVLGVAMITNLMVAGMFGTLIPLLMKRLGYDPATSATIFITTATDVLGFLAFLGLASAILQ